MKIFWEKFWQTASWCHGSLKVQGPGTAVPVYLPKWWSWFYVSNYMLTISCLHSVTWRWILTFSVSNHLQTNRYFKDVLIKQNIAKETIIKVFSMIYNILWKSLQCNGNIDARYKFIYHKGSFIKYVFKFNISWLQYLANVLGTI